jgi:hypothetical protein
MPYTLKDWTNRTASRSDLTSQLVHLTRGVESEEMVSDAVHILLKILREHRLDGSSTDSGFIVGARKAVCFQDVPLYSLCQNLYGEECNHNELPEAKIRYMGFGIMLPKPYVYRKGGRPVIYDKTRTAKQYLPETEWWRIVNFDLSRDERIIDWTHEREWRVPDELVFDLSEVTVLLSSPKGYKLFMERCKEEMNEDISEKIKGIVNLGAIFF